MLSSEIEKKSLKVFWYSWAGVFELVMLFLKHIFSLQFVLIVNLFWFFIN